MPSEKVWTPDLEVYNTPGLLSKDRTFASSNTVLIFYNGTVIDVPLANLVSVCIPNPTAYPFDKVTCSVTMGSWTHNAYKMKLNPTNNETKVELARLILSYGNSFRGFICISILTLHSGGYTRASKPDNVQVESSRYER